MSQVMWMVRAGEGGYLIEAFNNGYVAIGWDIGDLTSLTTRDALRSLYDRTYPNTPPAKAANAAAMLHKFRTVMKIGDRVISYDPQSREYLVGTISSDYQFEPGLVPDSPHVRVAKWDGRVSRDQLTVSSRNSLGSTLTLFLVNEDVANEIIGALAKGQGAPSDESAIEEKEELGQIKEETLAKAHELIKDRILALTDEDAERLVASVLRAMGYKARVTPKGPDRGADVIASPDGLGLEEPRIKAEVKHRSKTSMGSQEVRSFLGGLRSGDRALYVSTGGFTKDAKYEADRSNIPITLLNLDELASLVVTHYDAFDIEGRVLLPLARVYWPVE
jgi:restriction system protein